MAVADLRDQLQAALGDSYHLERELAPGGMSRLFLATERSLDRQVVIKLLPPEYASEVSAARFQREVTLTAHLQHPHVLPILAAGSKDGLLYYVMPYVDGESLRQRLTREGRLPVAAAVQILREIADALARAHEAGVVHRDIKPENILLQRDHALLADFGVARALQESTDNPRLTDTGTGLGTPGYMAPEQLAGDRHVDARADVYALAVVGYEMLVGTPPFGGATPQAVAAAHFTGAPKAIRQLRPEVAPSTSAAIARALAKDPDERFPSAGAFRDALVAPGTRATPSATPSVRWIAASVVALAIVGGGALGWRRIWGTEAGIKAAGPVRLAVLPFDNLGDSADTYFADGVTDAVRGKLTAVPGLEVIGPASSLQYRKTTKSPQQIGSELGVRYLLTGRVRWSKVAGAPNRVEVNPALIDAATAADKWEAPFDAPLTDVFQVQAEIATRVAHELQVALTPAAQRTIERQPTRNLDAYDAYLRGQAIENSQDIFSSNAAAAYAEAVRLDSTFALAWAGLARAHLSDMLVGETVRAADDAEAARVAAERALALAPQLAEAHAAQGSYDALVLRSQERALAEYETGRRVDPGDASLLRSSLESEWAVGHRDSALEQAETAARLDPRDALVLSDLCEVYRGLERYAEAAQSCDRAMALQPTNRDLVRKRLWVSLERGDLADAHAVVSHALVSIDSASLAVYMAEVDEMGWLLDRALERVLLRRQGVPIADRSTWMCALAQQYGYRGDTVRARAYADSARAEFAPALREMAASHRPIPPSAAAQAHVFYALSLAYLGRRDSAVAQAKLAEAAAPNEWYVQITMAKVFVLVNEPDAALAILQRGVAQPYAANVGLLNFVQRCTPAYLRIDPNFARLRGNPRFERLIAQPAAS